MAKSARNALNTTSKKRFVSLDLVLGVEIVIVEVGPDMGEEGWKVRIGHELAHTPAVAGVRGIHIEHFNDDRAHDVVRRKSLFGVLVTDPSSRLGKLALDIDLSVHL